MHSEHGLSNAARWREINTRIALPEDRERILELRRLGAERAFASVSEGTRIYNALVETRADPVKLDEQLESDHAFVMVATIGGKVVGTAQLEVVDGVGEMSAAATVRPDAGIGSALMRARLELAGEFALSKVWLETDTVNQDGVAHAVRHGFKSVSVRPGRTVPGNSVVRYERDLR